jgi:hypothetical protein
VTYSFLGRYRRKDARHPDRWTADRDAVMAVTTEALAGRGGMPGLLWSNAWLTEALSSGEDSPDEASFADTIPLTEIKPAYYPPSTTMRGRFRQTFVPGDRAA